MALPSTWQELITFFGALQGLVLVIALVTRVKRKSPANVLLIWFVLSLVFLLFAGTPSETGFFTLIKKGMSYIGDTVSFLYGPLLYLYTAKLLLNKQQRKQWLHFLPAIIFLITNVAIQLIGTAKLGSTFQQNYFAVVGVFAIAQFYTYIFLSFRLIKFYKNSVSQELSYTPSVNYLLTVIGFVTLCLTLFLIDFLSGVIGILPNVSFIDYGLAWTMISLLTFILAYYAIATPELFRISPTLKIAGTTDLKDFQVLKSNLLEKMEGQKLYLDPDLSLSTIAGRTGIRKEMISRVINQGLAKNFYRFVNEYRIEEFKRLVEDEQNRHITHLGLAYEAGFKSKTTFYKAFKEIIGSTPSEFLKAS